MERYACIPHNTWLVDVYNKTFSFSSITEEIKLPGAQAKTLSHSQVHTLLKGLEKIATSADIPMIVAGDFNSTPGSAAHDLLTQRSVRPDHKVCSGAGNV